MLYLGALQPLWLANALIACEESLVETQLAASETARLLMTQGKPEIRDRDELEHNPGRARLHTSQKSSSSRSQPLPALLSF